MDLGSDGNAEESKPEQLVNGESLTTVEVNLSRTSTVANDSPSHEGSDDDNDAVVQVTASGGVELELEISNGTTNIFVSRPRKRPATMTMNGQDYEDDPCEKKPRDHEETSVVPSSTAANSSIAKSNPMLSVKIAIRDWTRQNRRH